jgi:hypothetical protein
VNKEYILNKIKIDGKGCWVWREGKDRKPPPPIKRKYYLSHKLCWEKFLKD